MKPLETVLNLLALFDPLLQVVKEIMKDSRSSPAPASLAGCAVPSDRSFVLHAVRRCV